MHTIATLERAAALLTRWIETAVEVDELPTESEADRLAYMHACAAMQPSLRVLSALIQPVAPPRHSDVPSGAARRTHADLKAGFRRQIQLARSVRVNLFHVLAASQPAQSA